MNVLRLQVHNIMRISDLDLDLDGHHLVLVGGKNGQGKTSAIKSLLMALCGKRDMDFPEVVLKEGEDHGYVKVDLSGDEDLGDLNGFTIELGFRRRRGGKIEESLRLLDSTGEQSPQPRKLLSDLYSLRAFDPLSFEKAKPKEQVEMIRELLGLDFTELDKEHGKVYARRTEVNRQLKELEGARKTMRVPLRAPKEKVKVSELLAEIDKAKEHNKAGQLLLTATDDSHAEIEKQKAIKEKLLAQLASCEQAIEKACLEHKKNHEKLEAFKPIDITPLKEKIDSAEQTNADFDQATKVKETDENIRKVQKLADELTYTLESIEADKQARIESAAWPVEGMAIDSEGVTLKGLPFVQASRAERIRTSVKIAMAMNPKLKLMVSENGSDCDVDTLKELESICAEQDYQLIMEFVTRSGADEELCAVVLEEGQAKE
jgi:hypothetical protein